MLAKKLTNLSLDKKVWDLFRVKCARMGTKLSHRVEYLIKRDLKGK